MLKKAIGIEPRPKVAKPVQAEEEEEESEEEDVNGGGGGSSDRVDLGVQTSLLDSPSPTVPSPSTHTQV